MPDRDPVTTGERLVSASGLAAGYGGAAALTDVDLTVERGQRVGVLGPNGGGKTTLFRALLGELHPLAGTLQVRGRCGYVPQTERSRLDYPVSALDVAMMGVLARLPWWRRPGRDERRRARHALDVVGMLDLGRREFGSLSGGQRQRVLIARALVQEADLVLLDEPFAGVDEPSAGLLMDVIDRLAAEGRSVMVATHDIEQTRQWDLVVCLNRRLVAFGPPAETLTPRVIEETHAGTMLMLPESQRDGPRAVLLSPHHHDHEH
jgi:ABC-type Mn2+/Zn2+ transport system ATPase subunit